MKSSFKKNIIEAILLLMVLAILSVLFVFAQNGFYRRAYPLKYKDIIIRESERNSLPPELVFAVARTESGFNPNARSNVDARGIMQITQVAFDWAKMRGKTELDVSFDRLYEPELNIEYGTYILALLYGEYGDITTTLSAYHAGRNTVQKWLKDGRYSADGKIITSLPENQTSNYVKKVISAMRMYEKLYDI
ncbi:MAG TPA: transglycosylase [Ruminococcaceae bacterium]|nr:transglycosylase [Oscillospiraceae bacterium]